MWGDEVHAVKESLDLLEGFIVKDDRIQIAFLQRLNNILTHIV